MHISYLKETYIQRYMVKNIHVTVSDDEAEELQQAKSLKPGDDNYTWKELLQKGKEKVEG